MENGISIKEHEIGMGQPIICVSVTQKKIKDIVDEIKVLVSQKIEMIEWRIDFFEDIEKKEKIDEVIDQVKDQLNACIFLVTYRSKKQGGNGAFLEAEYKNLLFYLAKRKEVDLLDVELYTLKNANQCIADLKKEQMKIIVSHHDFDKTPSEQEMEQCLNEMHETNADIVKLAVMPQNMEDVYALLAITSKKQKEYAPKPLVTMSMGKEGMMSRFLGELTGSAITFGAFQRASAPGQVPMDQLQKILKLIHEL